MTKINAITYNEMLLHATKLLETKKKYVDSLNVFPVPDGDTGTNMCMTMNSGLKELQKKKLLTTGLISQRFSKGLLLGARGNSGVITSQFFRGLSEGLKETDEFTIADFTVALRTASTFAYKSVMKPVEGTILTVINDIAIAAENYNSNNKTMIEFFEYIISEGNISLKNTPNLLPVLKEANVVDSGGQGLIYILSGMFDSLRGEKLASSVETNFDDYVQAEVHPTNIEDITFTYCTEMLVELEAPTLFDLEDFRENIAKMGDSIVAIADDNILKCHIHTNMPNDLYEIGFKLGRIINLKAENMIIQAEEMQDLQTSNSPITREQGIVAVSSGNGISNVFKKITDVEIINGGQTLNPSIEQIIDSVRKVNAKNVFIFPNNSNIIMAANSTRDLLLKENINVTVIPTKHMTDSVEGLMAFNKKDSFSTNEANILAAISNLQSIEITNAIRNATIGGVEILKDDNIAIVNGEIKFANNNINKLLATVISNYLNSDVEIINIFKGKNGDDEIIKAFIDTIKEIDGMIEINSYDGEQDVYPYLISIF